MFAMTMQRHSSSSGVYVLNILFLLHIGTTLLTIIHASNKDFNDNEAIIQLSMDSIHVVRSSDPRIVHIEENVSDQEEKEILIALLTSFDDSNDDDKADELTKQNNIKIPLKPGAPSASAIRFLPSSLHFAEQPIAMAKMHSMTIVNDDAEPLELYSLSGTSVQFYSTYFEETVLPAHGGNTSIHVYYLPRTVGPTKSTFTIKTNRGHFYYQVAGLGTFNPFRVYPFVNAVVPLNSTFEHIVQFHNPYNCSLEVNEIYTSDENLIIELLEQKNPKNKISKAFEHHEQWHLKPYETKAIIKMNYIAYKLGLLHGFICIKTNSNDTVIIPVEINVSNRSGLYSSVDLLTFNADRLIRSVSPPITIPVYAINAGPNSATIAEVKLSSKVKDFVTVQTKRLPIPANLHRFNQIADLTIHPQRIPADIEQISEQIHFYTSSNRNESALQIPFYSRVVHGSLDYVRSETMFDVSLLKAQRSTQETSTCHPVQVINRFATDIAVWNVTTSQPELLADYLQMGLPESFEYLRPNRLSTLFCLTLLQPSLTSRSFSNVEAIMDIHTNLSVFHLPINLYNGHLDVGLPMDHRNGGIRRTESNLLILLVASISSGTSRTVTFLLINTNPIDIPLKSFDFTLPHADIQLEVIESLNETQWTGEPNRLYRNQNISQLVIPAQHQVSFSLRIQGKGPARFHNESIVLHTSYQKLRICVQYEIVDGSLEILNKTPMHIDASPNRLGSVDIYAHNKFDQTMTISLITFLTHGICFTFLGSSESTTIGPNQIEKIGILTFNMMTLCNHSQFAPESRSICGFDHHPEFNEQWNEHLAELNAHELDQSLVVKFRYFWKEWTTFLRQQKIHTNIWLHTDQANISSPVTIGFVWPSVLELMSGASIRGPIILDFQVTFINVTKTHNVLINNPSSQPVTYTVRLMETSSTTENTTESIFTISTSLKQVRVVDTAVYQFELQSEEQMIVTVYYRPVLAMKYDAYLIVRNNLTVLESIWLRGEGGAGSLNVGNRQSGSSTIPLILEMTEKHSHLCSNTNGNPRLQKIVTLANTGNLKTTIHEISFGNQKCSGKGFVVENCNEIEIGPNEKYYLKILFQPDYTLSEINEVLTLNTNIGLMTYPILVRIAPSVLSFCYQSIPRPIWELRSYYLCLCSLSVFIVLLFTVAVFEARSLFDNYLARAEYRDRIQMNENKIFDLSDLSMAVQDEQKTRERIESDKSTRSNSTKKTKSIDSPNHEPKSKGNSSTARRSLSSIEKNHSIPLKSAASSETLETSGLSMVTSSKSTRAKSSKQSEETAPKAQPPPRQKSANTSRDTPPALRPPTPSTALSSSAVSDEDSEPFVLARPRRASAKGKEVSTNGATKTTPTSVGLVSTSTPPGNTTRKLSTDVESSEQRAQQKNILIEEKSSDDQPWQTVVSNRERNRATRQETTNESGNANERTKPQSTQRNNTSVPSTVEKPKPAPSRRRPHSKRQKPAVPTAVRDKRASLQHDASSHWTQHELLFAQLTEQLRAAGLPNAATACSMSIRSRCSSAPASEFGGDDDEPLRTRASSNAADQPDDDEDEEEMIDWDEPDVPDDDFGLYASQTEHFLDRLSTMKPTQDKYAASNSIPPLMSIPVASPKPNGYAPLTSTLSAPTRKENVEPSMHSQHMPGPIQRPNRLPWPSTAQPPAFLSDSVQSPSTPDVLVQINHILHHQSSIQTVPSTPNVSHPDNASSTISDIPTPSVPWTPFSSNGWPSKYEPSWPIGSLPASEMSLRAASPQNPFVQRQVSKEETTVWPSVLGTATPRPVSTNTRTQRAAIWNELFPTAVSSSGDTPKTATNSSMKFWPSLDSSSNRPETETNNAFWNPMNLNGTAPAAPPSWWPKTPSDENNNDNDQSRWDFAR